MRSSRLSINVLIAQSESECAYLHSFYGVTLGNFGPGCPLTASIPPLQQLNYFIVATFFSADTFFCAPCRLLLPPIIFCRQPSLSWALSYVYDSFCRPSLSQAILYPYNFLFICHPSVRFSEIYWCHLAPYCNGVNTVARVTLPMLRHCIYCKRQSWVQ